MHLKCDLIIRIGDSCLTKNKQLPVYFLTETVEIDKPGIVANIENLNTDKNIIVRNVLLLSFFMMLNIHLIKQTARRLILP
jgi:diphthamide biosynthesis enzyme Dph1/Dph2-like protein